MNWIRKHIKTGSRLALLALAVQFVLAFGHVHPAHAQTISASVIAETVAAEYPVAAQPSADDHDQQHHRALSDDCAICAVLAMTASALFGAPPILHLPEAIDFLYHATDAGFAHLDPSHAVFQPRAPPVS